MLKDLLHLEERFTTTMVNKAPAKVWDAAWKDGAVEVDRRDQRFVVVRMDVLEKTLKDARSNRPQSLGDMLEGYDREEINKRTSDFMNDAPIGREIL